MRVFAVRANEAMNYFFTADTHYGHTNVITYSKRPFKDAQEMDEHMIAQWNAIVRPGDQVYHLGDFAFCDADKAVKIAKRLMGQKFLVFGNHDKHHRKNQQFVSQWAWTKDLADITISGQRIVLLHYAMRVWNQSHRGAWQLHGHSHGSLQDNPNALQLDVGVDCWNYTPVAFEDLAKRMKLKTYKPVDHHGRKDEEEE